MLVLLEGGRRGGEGVGGQMNTPKRKLPSKNPALSESNEEKLYMQRFQTKDAKILFSKLLVKIASASFISS